jgi:hypothetical protein
MTAKQQPGLKATRGCGMRHSSGLPLNIAFNDSPFGMQSLMVPPFNVYMALPFFITPFWAPYDLSIPPSTELLRIHKSALDAFIKLPIAATALKNLYVLWISYIYME